MVCKMEHFLVGLSKLVYELILTDVSAQGFGILFVEAIPSKTQVIIRIFIEHSFMNNSQNTKISLSDCEKASKKIEATLDESAIFLQEIGQKSYVLEVSSPGLQPPVCHISHFVRFAGNLAHIKLKIPFESKRNVTGHILRAENENIVLEIDKQEQSIPLSSIHKANIIFDDTQISQES